MIEFTEDYRNMGDATLGDDQVEGINFLLSRQNALLSFQTGLGKSLTVLVASKILLDKYEKSRVVIVCPVKAKKEFKKELFKRIGMSRQEVGIISTDEFDYDTDRNKYFLFTDTNVGKYNEIVAEIVAKGYKVILIVDEVHKLQEKKSKIYQEMLAIKSISTICWGVSATPCLNGLDGLYTIVNFIAPGFLGKKYEFDNMYTKWHLEDIYIKGGAKRKVKVIDSYQRLDELNKKLESLMIVRQKQYNLVFDNMTEPLTEEEYMLYEKVSSGILGDIKTQEERNFSRRLHDLQRFVDRSYDNDPEIKALVDKYGATDISTKENLLMKTLEKELEEGNSVIIYADYKDTIQRLHKVLKASRLKLDVGRIYEISGSIDIKTRERIEDKIQPRDIVLVTSAGTESINLQRCNTIIVYDTPFSAKVSVQLVGRICRRDTTHGTQRIVTIVTTGTIDEYRYRLFQKNLSVIQQAIGAATDININPEFYESDNKDIKQLKQELLWHYKGGHKASVNKKKKSLKELIRMSSIDDAELAECSNKFLIEPVELKEGSTIKRVEALFPDVDLYNRFKNGEVPFTVLRSKYVDYLKSPKGRSLLASLIKGAEQYNGLILVGETSLPKVLIDEIMSSVGGGY